MSEVVYRRVVWLHRLLVWPIVLLCGVIPILIYENEIREMLRPPPFEVLASHSEMMPNGRWRVTYDLFVRERCGSVTWRKAFRLDGAAEDLLPAAVASSRGVALAAISSGGNSPPEPLTFWLEYAPIHGGVGKFLVTGAFTDCPSGNDQILTFPPVAVNWR